MPLVIIGVLFSLASFVCAIFILIHAFQRSVGTGFMVLCIPCYILYYAFSQFEHPKKNMIIAGWLGFAIVGVILRIAGQMMMGGGRMGMGAF